MERNLEHFLLEQLGDPRGDLTDESGESVEVLSAVSFEDAGLLTSNRGVVVRLADGSEYQVTVTRSR
jgi:hypothetical protein